MSDIISQFNSMMKDFNDTFAKAEVSTAKLLSVVDRSKLIAALHAILEVDEGLPTWSLLKARQLAKEASKDVGPCIDCQDLLSAVKLIETINVCGLNMEGHLALVRDIAEKALEAGRD